MASKKSAKADEDVGQAFQPVAEPDATSAPKGPPASDYVVIVNLGKLPLPCHLANGRVENLGPRVAGQTIHRSKPVLKKLITPLIRSWKRKRMVAFEVLADGQ